MTRVRRAATLLVALTVALTASIVVTFAPPVSADPGSDSAVTMHGEGEFADLSVTVGQTKNLISQVVPITWSGASRTLPGPYNFGINFLQIMQCWGDEDTGPTREQCQYGASSDTRGYPLVATRQVNYDFTDPLETLKRPAGSSASVYVPFKSFDGETSTGGTSDLFGKDTTNEVPYAATRADGKGQEFFNVQSVQDAPGLGCGDPINVGGTTKGRSCWLVVVPRGDQEVDGTTHVGVSDPLESSPLSATNWAHRLKTKLEFEPVGDNCPIGAAERRTIGQEVVAEAVLRWQPSLCANGGAIFGYSQVPDDTSRRVVVGPKPGMVFIGRPLTAAENPKRLKVSYAPVALDGLSVAFNIDSASVTKAPADVKARDGQRLTEMKLTPRLVAKLVTQSYRNAVYVDAPSVQGNPTDMTQDPEFQALNPQFTPLRLNLAELLLPGGRADTTAQVWRWLLSDPEAKAFLEGTPDQWGMKLNPNYASIGLPRPDYPKADPYCRVFLDKPSTCTLDMHPYASDMHAGARAASRGDLLIKTIWDNTKEPPAFTKNPPQPSGQRQIMSLVDTASAAREGLATAAIRNAAGVFVKPTTESLLAGAAEMVPSTTPGVLSPAPAAKGSNAYPLATVGYAATVIPALDAPARKDYAAFLNYAAGDGQTPGLLPGQLPAGYAPMNKEMRAQTRKAATALLAYKDPAGSIDEGSPGDDVGPAGTAATTPPGTPPGSSTTDGPAAADPGTGTAADLPVPVALRTPLDSAGLVRLVPLLALGLGLAAAVCGPVMIGLARRRRTSIPL